MSPGSGEEVRVEDPQWFNKPPGTNNVTPPHQDNYYFCLAPSNVVTVWMALDDVDAENGCLLLAREGLDVRLVVGRDVGGGTVRVLDGLGAFEVFEVGLGHVVSNG